ncbi:DUF4097 family beta strand repeat-containing protein [Streptomyces sp. NPDC001443]
MQKFHTPAPVHAVLDIPAGRVRIVAADRTDTLVEVRPADASRRRDTRAAERTAVTCADGRLQITAPAADGRLTGPSGSVEVTVQLPSGSRIEANAAATEFHTAGRCGDITVDGAYRRIEIDEAASLRLTAVDGDVQVGRLDGPADISTARGAIRITEAVRGTLVLRTRSGDITVGAATGVPAALDAGTGHGRIHNSLANSGTTALDIHATTAHGDITAHSL